MRLLTWAVSLSALLVPAAASAQAMSPEEIIRSAVRAGPSPISEEAAVWDWGTDTEGEILHRS